MNVESFRQAIEAVPPAAVAAWVAALGLTLGSFANVVIHRLPRGESVVRPRSRCPSCSRMIPWHENVPILSWLRLRARCAGCGGRISWRYPAVEALVAALLVASYLKFGLGWGFVVAGLLCFLVTCLVLIDAEHYLLPDALTLKGAFAALVLSWVSPFVTPAGALAGCLFAATLLEILNLAYRLMRGHDGLGAGDTKMLMAVGAFLGWELALFTLLVASVTGLAVGVPALAFARRRLAAATRSKEGGASEASEEDDSTGGAAQDLAGDGPSALAALLPREAIDLALLAAWFVLVLSFLGLVTTPDRALLGLLVGLALREGAGRLLARGRGDASRGRLLELIPLGLATLGLPPTARSAAVLAGLGLFVAAAGRPMDRFLRAHAPPLPPADESALPGPRTGPLMQMPLPLGVFLGVGAILALFFGGDLIAWYFDAWPFSGGRD